MCKKHLSLLISSALIDFLLNKYTWHDVSEQNLLSHISEKIVFLNKKKCWNQ